MNAICDFQELRIQAIDYAKSLRCGDSFVFRNSHAPDSQPVAIASSVAALLLNFLNALDNYSPAEKSQWRDYLLANLGSDGLYSDEVDLGHPTQDQPLWALKLHRTRHIVWAIEALGGSVSNQPGIIEPLLGKGNANAWLEDLWQQDWPGGFWAAGNWIMDIGVMLDIAWRHMGNRQALDASHELMDALDAKQCQETGFWFGPNDTNREAMAGAMHLYPMYWANGRNVRFFDRAVKETLKLQQADGLFDYETGSGGSQCLDYDAILVLSNGAILTPQYRNEIRTAAERVLAEIMCNHQPDGSFSDSRQPLQRYWATKAAAYQADKGSLWDTYARLMTIASCIELSTGRLPDNASFEHHWFEIFHGLWKRMV